jgi:hypothetical protein
MAESGPKKRFVANTRTRFITDNEMIVLVLFVEGKLMLCGKETGFLVKVIFASPVDVRRHEPSKILFFVIM